MTQGPVNIAAEGGRTVARPVANLGNTCFANAVLQALAHAPELCLAMDCRPHSQTCPVARENSAKMRASPSASPTEDRSTGTRKSRRSVDRSSDEDELEFCALCSLEHHMEQVHDSMQPRDKPVAPEAFIKGFVTHVAPWMRIGIQEDSHEFLRLLIDAMQKSCLRARADKENTKQGRTLRSSSASPSPEDKEYSFSLFRGLVESTVTCESCKASSSTVDPIEDIGLEVTTVQTGYDGSPHPPLADVQTAFSGFARAEALDSNYKCEKCGKVGKATKQSRLKSIPPILTLHLKRFRYGDSRHGADAMPRRSGRSEVKSGSAKIEGHIKFELLFDLKPYLTEELQGKSKSSVFCRLFAVVVHAGKNSNSGHYIAYVRNLEKNEWWKMDDGRINPVHPNEVLNAEAYMLFYRVVHHPITMELEECYRDMIQRSKVENAVVVDEETDAKPVKVGTSPKNTTGKRKLRSFKCGDDWARTRKSLPPYMNGIIRKVEENMANSVQLTPEFFRLVSDAAAGYIPTEFGNYDFQDGRFSKRLPVAIEDITENDVVGDQDIAKIKLLEMLHKIVVYCQGSGQAWSLSDEADSDPMSSRSISSQPAQTALSAKALTMISNALVSVVEPEDANLL